MASPRRSAATSGAQADDKELANPDVENTEEEFEDDVEHSRVVNMVDGKIVEDEDDEWEEAEEPEEPEKPHIQRVAEPRPPSLPRDVKRDKNGFVFVTHVVDPDRPERVTQFWDIDDRHPKKKGKDGKEISGKEVVIRTGQKARVYPNPAVIRALRDGRLEPVEAKKG